MERWLLERHESRLGRAECRARLIGHLPAPRLGASLAAFLRRLADLIDRNPSTEPYVSASAKLISNGPF